jgi:hypothetical protein
MSTARFLAFRFLRHSQTVFTARPQSRGAATKDKGISRKGPKTKMHNKATKAAKIRDRKSLFVAFAALL